MDNAIISIEIISDRLTVSEKWFLAGVVGLAFLYFYNPNWYSQLLKKVKL